MSARLPPFTPVWALGTGCRRWQRGVTLAAGIFLASGCSALSYQVGWGKLKAARRRRRRRWWWWEKLDTPLILNRLESISRLLACEKRDERDVERESAGGCTAVKAGLWPCFLKTSVEWFVERYLLYIITSLLSALTRKVTGYNYVTMSGDNRFAKNTPVKTIKLQISIRENRRQRGLIK